MYGPWVGGGIVTSQARLDRGPRTGAALAPPDRIPGDGPRGPYHRIRIRIRAASPPGLAPRFTHGSRGVARPDQSHAAAIDHATWQGPYRAATPLTRPRTRAGPPGRRPRRRQEAPSPSTRTGPARRSALTRRMHAWPLQGHRVRWHCAALSVSRTPIASVSRTDSPVSG